MACELIANLSRVDKAALLIEKLQDPHTNVRQTAAVALARMNAVEALPALTEVTRGTRNQGPLPPGLRGAGPDPYERLVMLSCIRILRGEKDDLVISTVPNSRDGSWPEVDRVLTEQQVELVKLFKLVDVVMDGNEILGAVLKGPDEKEILYRIGEAVAAGFKLRTAAAGYTGKDKTSVPASAILMRGDDRVMLIQGKPAEVELAKDKKK